MSSIHGGSLQGYGKKFTYRDYCKLDDEVRYEVIEGELFMMAGPRGFHQIVIVKIITQLDNQLEGKKCRPYISPIDVRLFYKDDDSDDTIVQPDILVSCDKNRFKNGVICGVPEFIIEVISESSKRRDRLLKTNIYSEAGVKEYWIIDIETRQISIGILEDGIYDFRVEEMEGCISSHLGFSIDFDKVNNAIKYYD